MYALLFVGAFENLSSFSVGEFKVFLDEAKFVLLYVTCICIDVNNNNMAWRVEYYPRESGTHFSFSDYSKTSVFSF